MKLKLMFIFLAILGFVCFDQVGPGQQEPAHAGLAGPARQGMETIIRTISGKGSNAVLELAEFGGEAGVRRISERAAREGGDEALGGLARLVDSHGVDALRAADNAVNIPGLIRAMNDLPNELTGPALRRLSGSEGRALAEMVERYGSAALRAEATHPGIGIRSMSSLGRDGAELIVRMNRDQAVTFGRHLDDIAKLPALQKQGIVELLYRDMERMAVFMGRFIENNPGKVLFTVSATAVILDNSGRFLGDGHIAFDAEGNPYFVASPGLFERALQSMIMPFVKIAAIIFGLFISLRLGLSLWYSIRRSRKKYEEFLHAGKFGSEGSGK